MPLEVVKTVINPKPREEEIRQNKRQKNNFPQFRSRIDTINDDLQLSISEVEEIKLFKVSTEVVQSKDNNPNTMLQNLLYSKNKPKAPETVVKRALVGADLSKLIVTCTDTKEVTIQDVQAKDECNKLLKLDHEKLQETIRQMRELRHRQNRPLDMPERALPPSPRPISPFKLHHPINSSILSSSSSTVNHSPRTERSLNFDRKTLIALSEQRRREAQLHPSRVFDTSEAHCTNNNSNKTNNNSNFHTAYPDHNVDHAIDWALQSSHFHVKDLEPELLAFEKSLKSDLNEKVHSDTSDDDDRDHSYHSSVLGGGRSPRRGNNYHKKQSPHHQNEIKHKKNQANYNITETDVAQKIESELYDLDKTLHRDMLRRQQIKAAQEKRLQRQLKIAQQQQLALQQNLSQTKNVHLHHNNPHYTHNSHTRKLRSYHGNNPHASSSTSLSIKHSASQISMLSDETAATKITAQSTQTFSKPPNISVSSNPKMTNKSSKASQLRYGENEQDITIASTGVEIVHDTQMMKLKQRKRLFESSLSFRSPKINTNSINNHDAGEGKNPDVPSSSSSRRNSKINTNTVNNSTTTNSDNNAANNVHKEVSVSHTGSRQHSRRNSRVDLFMGASYSYSRRNSDISALTTHNNIHMVRSVSFVLPDEDDSTSIVSNKHNLSFSSNNNTNNSTNNNKANNVEDETVSLASLSTSNMSLLFQHHYNEQTPNAGLSPVPPATLPSSRHISIHSFNHGNDGTRLSLPGGRAAMFITKHAAGMSHGLSTYRRLTFTSPPKVQHDPNNSTNIDNSNTNVINDNNDTKNTNNYNNNTIIDSNNNSNSSAVEAKGENSNLSAAAESDVHIHASSSSASMVSSNSNRQGDNAGTLVEDDKSETASSAYPLVTTIKSQKLKPVNAFKNIDPLTYNSNTINNNDNNNDYDPAMRAQLLQERFQKLYIVDDIVDRVLSIAKAYTDKLQQQTQQDSLYTLPPRELAPHNRQDCGDMLMKRARLAQEAYWTQHVKRQHKHRLPPNQTQNKANNQNNNNNISSQNTVNSYSNHTSVTTSSRSTSHPNIGYFPDDISTAMSYQTNNNTATNSYNNNSDKNGNKTSFNPLLAPRSSIESSVGDPFGEHKHRATPSVLYFVSPLDTLSRKIALDGNADVSRPSLPYRDTEMHDLAKLTAKKENKEIGAHRVEHNYLIDQLKDKIEGQAYIERVKQIEEQSDAIFAAKRTGKAIVWDMKIMKDVAVSLSKRATRNVSRLVTHWQQNQEEHTQALVEEVQSLTDMQFIRPIVQRHRREQLLCLDLQQMAYLVRKLSPRDLSMTSGVTDMNNNHPARHSNLMKQFSAQKYKHNHDKNEEDDEEDDDSEAHDFFPETNIPTKINTSHTMETTNISMIKNNQLPVRHKKAVVSAPKFINNNIKNSGFFLTQRRLSQSSNTSSTLGTSRPSSSTTNTTNNSNNDNNDNVMSLTSSNLAALTLHHQEKAKSSSVTEVHTYVTNDTADNVHTNNTQHSAPDTYTHRKRQERENQQLQALITQDTQEKATRWLKVKRIQRDLLRRHRHWRHDFQHCFAYARLMEDRLIRHQEEFELLGRQRVRKKSWFVNLLRKIQRLKRSAASAKAVPVSLFLLLATLKKLIVLDVVFSKDVVWKLVDETVAAEEYGSNLVYSALQIVFDSVGITAEEVYQRLKTRLQLSKKETSPNNEPNNSPNKKQHVIYAGNSSLQQIHLAPKLLANVRKERKMKQLRQRIARQQEKRARQRQKKRHKLMKQQTALGALLENETDSDDDAANNNNRNTSSMKTPKHGQLKTSHAHSGSAPSSPRNKASSPRNNKVSFKTQEENVPAHMSNSANNHSSNPPLGITAVPLLSSPPTLRRVSSRASVCTAEEDTHTEDDTSSVGSEDTSSVMSSEDSLYQSKNNSDNDDDNDSMLSDLEEYVLQQGGAGGELDEDDMLLMDGDFDLDNLDLHAYL